MLDHSQDDRIAGSLTGQGSADAPAYSVEQALHNLQQIEDPKYLDKNKRYLLG